MSRESRPDSRPMASLLCEQEAMRLFPLTMTPEEYAARCGENWVGSFTFARYRFFNVELDAWIQRFAAILTTREPLR